MKINSSFAENHHFIKKENWNDAQSIMDPIQWTMGFPISKYPSKQPIHKELEKYGVPAGLVMFQSSKPFIGGYTESITKHSLQENKEKKVISDELYDCLFSKTCVKETPSHRNNHNKKEENTKNTQKHYMTRKTHPK